MTEFDTSAFDAFEVAGWGTKEAATYDALAGRVTARFAEPLLDAVGAGAGTRLLDVATGPGYVAASAATRGAKVTAVDFSETMLAFARERTPEVEFVRGDATDLPFEDATFDAVTAAFLLLHVGAPERAVAEAARVLSPGGRAAFSVWDVPARGRWIGVFFDAFTAAGAHPPAEVPEGPSFFRLADDAEFTTLLAGGGLVDVDVSTVQFDLHVRDGDELWNGLVEGSVRVGPLILGQPDELRQRIRERYDELLETYRAQDGFDVPVSAKVAAGAKP